MSEIESYQIEFICKIISNSCNVYIPKITKTSFARKIF